MGGCPVPWLNKRLSQWDSPAHFPSLGAASGHPKLTDHPPLHRNTNSVVCLLRHLWHRAPRNLHIYPQSPGTRALSSPEPRLPSPSPRSMDHCLGLGKARVEPDVMKPEVGVAPPSPVSLTPDLLSSLRDFPALTPGEKKKGLLLPHTTPLTCSGLCRAVKRLCPATSITLCKAHA